MELNALSIIRSVPDVSTEIVGVVPQFGGKCFDIILQTMESATQLVAAGFDYDNAVKPLRLLGTRTIHVSVFISLEFPGKDFLHFLKQHGQLKSDSLQCLYYSDEGFTHIERGIHVGGVCVAGAGSTAKIGYPGAGDLF